jgi:hypothetical protein
MAADAQNSPTRSSSATASSASPFCWRRTPTRRCTDGGYMRLSGLGATAVASNGSVANMAGIATGSMQSVRPVGRGLSLQDRTLRCRVLSNQPAPVTSEQHLPMGGVLAADGGSVDQRVGLAAAQTGVRGRFRRWPSADRFTGLASMQELAEVLSRVVRSFRRREVSKVAAPRRCRGCRNFGTHPTRRGKRLLYPPVAKRRPWDSRTQRSARKHWRRK